MLTSLLGHSRCLLAGCEKQIGTDSPQSSIFLDPGSLSQESWHHETIFSSIDANGTLGELDSITPIMSPIMGHEMPFQTGRTSYSFESKRLAENRANCVPPAFFETPKAMTKVIPLRRRLLQSHLASDGSVQSSKTPQQSLEVNPSNYSCSRLYSEDGICLDSSLDSPGDLNFEALGVSTLKGEERTTSCRNKRYLFAQQRTSTVDDLKSKNQLAPDKCATPDGFPIYNLDISNLCCSRGNTVCSLTEPFKTPSGSGKVTVIEEHQFLTPMNKFAENLNLNLPLCESLPRSPSHEKLDASITEDSGYNSVGLEKSDSFSNHEGSFQELVQLEETPKTVDHKKHLRTLERSKRLSTLRERGSQSEAEDETKNVVLKGSGYILRDSEVSVTEDTVFEKEACNESLLDVEDLSYMPALQLVKEMCMRKRKRPEDQGLLTLAESKLSLPGLIGRKMGLEKVDMLKELLSRNLMHILTLILGYISVEDICRAWKASKVWKKIIKQDKTAYLKRKRYLDKIRELKVGSFPWAPDAETRCNLPNRSAFKTVQAQALTRTPQRQVDSAERSSNPRSASKREEFLKIAKTLFNNEALKPCPRCQSPAKYNPMKKQGLCSSDDCAFDFCTQCFCAFHGSKECSSRSAKCLGKKEAAPGSAQSKRNLKRL
ncbi:F-box only protein 43 [Callorhinchus milii]|uniref:F-box only protein 43 n=1 Tax=Callorhinchus milii TaxID=7868 RepID=V9KHG6_CALMI|nr:F-box only protein 43 [Callorhinchus milii]